MSTETQMNGQGCSAIQGKTSSLFRAAAPPKWLIQEVPQSSQEIKTCNMWQDRLKKESGNSYSVGNLMNSHSGIRNSRRNIKVTNSIVFQRGLFSSKFDTSDIVKDIVMLEQQLANIESSYLQSVQEQSSSDQQESNVDTQNVSNPIKAENYDDAIKQLIETNKLTLSRLRKVNELISSSVEKLDKPDSPDNNAIIKEKENELFTMQSKWVKIKSKIDLRSNLNMS